MTFRSNLPKQGVAPVKKTGAGIYVVGAEAGPVLTIEEGRPLEAEFVHDASPPEDWVRQLRDLSPIRESDDVGYLELLWEPGDPWAPVQRWEIYEISPRHAVPTALLHAFKTAGHPRKEGHPCTSKPVSSWAARPNFNYVPCHCKRKSEAWRGGLTDIPLTAWKLFQRTGRVGYPFWIIQGDRGGHRRQFSEQEERLLQHQGLPTKLPAPGELPYAPFDGRVINGCIGYNRLREFHGNIAEYKKAMGKGHSSYVAEKEKELRRKLLTNLATQMSADLPGEKSVEGSFIGAMDKGELDNQPRTNIDFDRVWAKTEESFVETGQLASVREGLDAHPTITVPTTVS
ncbi:MAG TPA: hypothetical protein VNN79_22950 [Actinomycetota bacterium]|nr:hypothetical protein [Actinomycetota bacterium]